jgi:spermidine synthase
VLADSRVESCTVVEIEQSVVDWMRAGLVPHGPPLLADERVEVVTADVALALREAPPGAYDLILLDVDNGPGYLVHDANADLYRAPSLEDARRAAAPGGLVVIWSAAESPELAATMERVFGTVEGHEYAVDLQGRDESYWLYASAV